MVVHLRQIVRRIEHQCLDVEPADGAEQRVGGDHAIALRASLHQATRSGPQSRRLSGLRVQLQLTTWSTAPIPPITMTCSRATPVGPTGCAGFELTHRRKVTPSSMWRPNSTQATRKNPVNSIDRELGRRNGSGHDLHVSHALQMALEPPWIYPPTSYSNP